MSFNKRGRTGRKAESSPPKRGGLEGGIWPFSTDANRGNGGGTRKTFKEQGTTERVVSRINMRRPKKSPNLSTAPGKGEVMGKRKPKLDERKGSALLKGSVNKRPGHRDEETHPRSMKEPYPYRSQDLPSGRAKPPLQSLHLTQKE